MHRQRHLDPWPESRQLCESIPFQAFCRSSLPTPDQQVICQACGLPVQPSTSSQSRCDPISPDSDQYGDPFLSYDLHYSPYRLSSHPHSPCGTCGPVGG